MDFAQKILHSTYKTDAESDHLNDEMKRFLGLRPRYGPARLAIALSLSDPAPLQEKFFGAGKKDGRDIHGVQMFDREAVETTIALIIAHAGCQLSVSEFKHQVGAHWARGLVMMHNRLGQYEDTPDESKYEKFLLYLSHKAGYAAETTGGAPVPPSSEPPHPAPVRVVIGQRDGDDIPWTVNAPGGSPHLAVMGEPNTGKTRLALRVAEAIKKQSACHAFVFDMGKGDISADAEFVSAIGAKVISTPQSSIPLNLLHVSDPSDNAEVQRVASRFADSLSFVSQKGFGDVQKSDLREIVAKLVKQGNSVTLAMILQEAQNRYGEDRSNTVIAALAMANDFNLFSPDMSPAEFFNSSWVFDMHEADEGIQRFTAFVLLTAHIRHLMSTPDSATDSAGHRKITSLLVIDESRKVLAYKHPALVDMIKLSRSKGGVAVLISQSPEDYIQESDYIADIGASVCFRTNAPTAKVQRVLRTSLRAHNLQPGECLARLPNHDTLAVRAWRQGML